MGKTKKNKKGMSEKIASKSKGPAKLNPFDIRFVKSKQNVIGRKVKLDVGKPGLARAKAIQKRKETLLQEYQLKKKNNLFLDKRIGEKDSNLSAEEKMVARFTAERVKGVGKSSIFNLGDDFGLTHGGTSIEDMDKFDNPRSDDDEDTEELLSKNFVEEAHFGGFMSKSDDEFKAGKGNSRKEIIENLIRESKKKKAEKRKADEEAEEKTTELDGNWKDLMQSLRHLKGSNSEESGEVKYDPYDMLVKQLGFEKKEARGGERMKTAEEKITEEKEKLEKLEEDRQRRMRGDQPGRSHVSVEDLGDVNVKMKNKISLKEKRKLLKQLLKDQVNEDDDQKEDNAVGAKESDDESGEEEETDEDDEDDGSDEYSDLEDSDKEDIPIVSNEKDQFDKELEDIKATASKEIPYVISVPDSYSSLCSLVWGRTPSDLTIVLDRILACNHPQLGDHKPALVIYFSHLLQLVQDLSALTEDKNQLASLSILSCHLAKLTPFFQQEAAQEMLEVIKNKFDQWTNQPRPRFPGLDTILILHLVNLLFPTSDYRHPVVTPAIILASSILSTSRPTDRATFSLSILTCSIITEYATLSNRISPELVSNLHGLLYVSVTTPPSTRPPPPCKGGNYLLIQSDSTNLSVEKIDISETGSVKDIDDQFRVNMLHSTLILINRLFMMYSKVASVGDILSPLQTTASCIKEEKYPGQVVELLRKVIGASLSLKKRKVIRPAKQVPMLRMMEPKVEDDFDPFKKKRTGNRDLLEEQKMRHKVKQERKGARKEIRQDTAFLATEKAKDARRKDLERQEKTKSIFSGLANQEGDYNKMLKKKKKF